MIVMIRGRPVSITVATASPEAELQARKTFPDWVPAYGAGAIGLGFLAGPMVGGAMVLGGGMILLLDAGLTGVESATAATMGRILQEVDFPSLLRAVLAARSVAAVSADAVPTTEATATVLSYGLLRRDRGMRADTCAVAALRLAVRQQGRVLSDTAMTIEPDDRPTRSAPAQCAEAGIFTENDGRLIRTTFRDYAEVLAATILRHLEANP